MSIADILNQFTGNPSDPHGTFDSVASQAPTEDLGQGIAAAFRSDQTPAFGNMLGSLFGGSNPQQRAGVLNQILGSVGPSILSGVAGGALGRMLQGAMGGGSGAPTVSPSDAAKLTPEQMQQLGAAAEQHDPGIVDKVGAYYAQHPEVVKVLGGAALAVVLGHMANRGGR